MWNIEETVIQEGLIYQYRIREGAKVLSFKEVLGLLKTDLNFRSFYKTILVETSLPAFFWEHPPLSVSSLAQEYEFVLYKSKTLESIRANPMAFQDYLERSFR